MKKFVSIFICIVFVMLSGTIANANSFVSSNSAQGAYILTETCPQDVVDFAKTSFDSFSYSDEHPNSQIELGTPFSLTNEDMERTLYYFPVIINEQIEYTYRIFYSNGWQYVLSECLAEELNSASEYSTVSNPTIVYLNDNSNIVVQNSKYESTVIVDPTRNAMSKNSIKNTVSYVDKFNELNSGQATTVVNMLSKIKTINYYEMINTRASSAKSKYLSPTIRERQGPLPWCAGYVTAYIVSYKTGTAYYAREVAQFAGSSETESISRSKCVRFAKDKGLSNTRETIFDASDNTMMEQIDNSCPVYVGADLIGSDSSHAFAVIGYSWSGSAITNWRVWNPWNNYTEDISSRAYSTADGSAVFDDWESFIINFNND